MAPRSRSAKMPERRRTAKLSKTASEAHCPGVAVVTRSDLALNGTEPPDCRSSLVFRPMPFAKPFRSASHFSRSGQMNKSTRLSINLGVFAATVWIGATAATAGCTDNLTADRELNIRTGPSTSSDPIARIPGEACGIRIGRCSDGWCQVTYRGVEGFASTFYLQRTEERRRRNPRWEGIAERNFAPLRSDSRWQPVGTLDVDQRRNRDVIQLDRRDGRFDALRIRVRGAPVRFSRLVVVYGNGVRDNLGVARLIGPNEESGLLELRGNRGRFIDRIIFVYGPARPRGRSAEVEVWARSSVGDPISRR